MVYGTPLKKMSEKDFYYNDSGSTNYRRNVPDDGSPSFYYISGGHIQFDSNPNATDEMMLYYKSRISSPDVNKLIYANIARSNIDIPSTLGAELDGLTFTSPNFNLLKITYMYPQQQTFPYLLDPYYSNTDIKKNNDFINQYSSKYSGTSVGDSTGVRMGQIVGFGSKAPVIPSEYQLSLCDYAIAIASAKKNPDIHDRHLSIWTARMQDIKNKDADKDLMFNIREVV